MKQGTSSFRAYHAITSVQVVPRVETAELFNVTSQDGLASPIDHFIANTDAINKIYLAFDPAKAVVPQELGALTILGYMSAVEGYFRALLRQLIEVDEFTRSLAEPLDVTFAAARYHRPEYLAEALAEGVSFASKVNVEEAIRKRIGIKGNFPVDVDAVLAEFGKVCEVRHCCAHRFGKLGSKNAVSLGVQKHKDLLEKPFSPTMDQIQTIADLLRTFVKTINNFVFRSVIERIGTKDHLGHLVSSWEWSGDYRKDRKRFLQYYTLFAAQADNPPSPDARTVYADLKAYVNSRR